MAKKQARPGRTLIMFFLGVAIAYGLVALTGTWKPTLGLDLQGGTRITLQAQGNPGQANLNEAKDIIDSRVNGSGVSEAEVSTQGGNVIVVEIPGEQRRDLIETVERQAQLRFRLVACSPNTNPSCQPSAANPIESPGDIPKTADPTDPVSVGPGQTETPGTGSSSGPATNAPSGSGTGKPGAGKPGTGTASPGGANRVAPFAADTTEPGKGKGTATATDAPTGSATDTATDTPTDTATDGATTSPSPTETPGATDTATADPNQDPNDFDQNAVVSLDEGVAFMNGGFTAEDSALYSTHTCDDQGNVIDATTGQPAPQVDNPVKPLIGCSPPSGDPEGTDYSPPALYLLSPAIIEGTDVSDASYQTPQNGVGYEVTLDLKGSGKDVFTQASQTLVHDVDQFAIVLDGQVISAPTFQGVIQGGTASITGDFTDTEADSLATSLRYGALPVSFDEPSTTTVGPSLAGNQLTAGLTAGAFGLGLVLIYCLLYYRGLGIVVVASLLVAAAVTYALVLLLSESAGFTLTLPGIAGLIIAVGITADSFIIFFERIRDEMRDGKSMRVAVESGWKRAKVTRLAAQVVSLLSAAVLYIFATGAVKGFGFALGLTTIVDLAILFWFTKPMVSWLAHFKFYNSGHRFSGLSAGTLGIDGPGRGSVEGGKA